MNRPPKERTWPWIVLGVAVLLIALLMVGPWFLPGGLERNYSVGAYQIQFFRRWSFGLDAFKGGHTEVFSRTRGEPPRTVTVNRNIATYSLCFGWGSVSVREQSENPFVAIHEE